MRWYRDRFLLWVLLIIVGALVLPFKYVGGSLIYIGEKIDNIGEWIVNSRIVNRIDIFVRNHKIDTDMRKAAKRNGKAT